MKNQSLKIAITTDPEIPVPPVYYGGIERMVYMLAQEYILAGHEVTVFAHPDSKIDGKLVPYPGKKSRGILNTLKNMSLITQKVHIGNFDILHSFSRLAYSAFLLPCSIPKIMSYQRRATKSQIVKAQKLAKKGSLIFTGCSNHITQQISSYAQAHTIYNGFQSTKFEYNEHITDDAPLVFLGRIEPIKGAHHAIEIARKANKKLIIAGNIPLKYQEYFNNRISPFINNRQISYIGAVNDEQKSHLLKQALAFLMPIEWDEPFGIVMVEAMACGTPVIAFPKGAVPEIVEDGVTGYMVNNVEEAVEKVAKIHLLDRRIVRQEALNRFDSKVIAKNYLDLYKWHIDNQTLSSRILTRKS